MPGVSRRRSNVRGLALLLCLVAGVALTAFARTTPQVPAEVALADLPPEARDVYARVGKGGPFPYDRDGIAFGNREQLLPSKPRDYYREYTVRTPGVKGRGGRRLVCGGAPRIPDACYYTADHYRSFRKIRP
jgi:ribonuclease T1